MSTTTRLVTADEFFDWPSDSLRHELVRGEVRTMSLPGAEHGEITGEIFGVLREHVKRQVLGKVYAADTGFLVARDPDTVLGPDVSFVRRERLAEIVDRRKYVPFAPDLAVEVISPGDRAGEIAEKTADWLAAGVRMLWNVYPRSRTIVIHVPGEAPRTLGEDDRLDGGAVLPGFECRVGELFVE